MKKTAFYVIFSINASALFPIVVFGQVIALFDLENLKNQGFGDITAYEKIKIIDTWNLIEQIKPSILPVTVGIFDTGIDLTHPEFRQASIATLTISDAEQGGHGTQVAGIIGANNLSFAGQYIPFQMNGILSGVRNLNYTLQIRSSGVFAAFTTSTDNMHHFTVLDQLARSPSGIQIINGSFGMPLCDTLPLARRIIRFASGLPCYDNIVKFNNDKDIYIDLVNQYSSTTFVFGAGNDGINANQFLPGGGVIAPNVITIGAADLNDERAIFSTIFLEQSNFGPTINISAPGVEIYAPKPLSLLGGDYDFNFGGTSGAALMVTGVAAILKSIRPTSTPVEIKNILISSADPLFVSSTSPEAEKTLGSGCSGAPPPGQVLRGCRLNAHRAVAWQFPPASSTLATTTITLNSISLSWNLPNFDFHNPDFDSYKLFRSASSPVTQSSTLVQTVTETSTTTFTDTSLSPNITFFYKLITFDKAGLSSESNELSATTLGAPVIPDIRGLYIGTAISSQTNCQNPADNITVSWPNATINISSQSNGNFNATGTVAAVVNSDVFLDNFVIAGSVSESGNLSGTVANTFFINDIFNSGGQGTFTGQFLNDILNLSFSTQDIVGDTCSVQGTLTAVRQ